MSAQREPHICDTCNKVFPYEGPGPLPPELVPDAPGTPVI